MRMGNRGQSRHTEGSKKVPHEDTVNHEV